MSKSINFDTNVENYSIAELMAISEINDLDKEEIKTQTNKRIKMYEQSDPTISVFFMDIQSQLLQYANDLEDEQNLLEDVQGRETQNTDDAEYPLAERQQNNWYVNEALPQENNPTQKDKITERKQKIDVFGNAHVPMNREQLGINNNFQVDVAQDTLNPNLKNTITRFVNIDSQFRQYSNGFETTATDFTMDLSVPLTNALSLRLYSYQIPFTWYTIDPAYGNTCFWITDVSSNTNVPVSVPAGNYSASQFVTTLNKSFQTMGFTFPSGVTPVTYNENSGKITLYLYGGVYPGGTVTVDGAAVVLPGFTITTSTFITFYDYTSRLQCEYTCVNKSFYMNQTLGWLMGYRVPSVKVVEAGNVAVAVLDLIGTKYLILVVDDYNQNHVNNGLVSIAEYSNVLKMPSYYSPDLPYICLPSGASTAGVADANNVNDFLISGKFNIEYSKTAVVLPSAPRTLTNSQLYTINEINRNKNNNTNFRAKAPTSPDILAIVPIKLTGNSTGSLFVDFSGSLQDNSRTYFGPVNIERMRIKLLNDKGNVLNLNGVDWCVTLICDCLYQY